MNLYIEEISRYLTSAWDEILNDQTGSKSACFILESLPPSQTFEVLAKVEEHYKHQLQKQPTLQRHFKVASGLWKAWQNTFSREELINQMKAYHAVGSSGELLWIDEDDRLTFFRNITRQPNQEGLLTILIGLSHTTDQGGLSDFKRVDENLIWERMGQSTMPWVKQLDEHYQLMASESELDSMNQAIIELFRVRSRHLPNLADYLSKITKTDLGDMEHLRDMFFKELSYWSLPPLLDISSIKAKDTPGLLEAIDNFISHKSASTQAKQRDLLKKVGHMLDDEDFVLPTVVGDTSPYKDLEDFRGTIDKFVKNNDIEAKTRLEQTDSTVIATVLRKAPRKKSPTDPAPEKAPKLHKVRGGLVEVLCESLWLSIRTAVNKGKSKQQPSKTLVHLEGIEIIVTEFRHDLDSEELARDLLIGYLGGLSEWFSQHAEITLPYDQEQALENAHSWSKRISPELHMQDIAYKGKSGSSDPYIGFHVRLVFESNSLSDIKTKFQWVFKDIHAERVRYSYARYLLECWPEQDKQGNPILPMLKLPHNAMTAIYYAADEEEANRLLSNALTGLKVENLMEDLNDFPFPFDLTEALRVFISNYYEWLSGYVERGYFSAIQHYHHIEKSYESLVEKLLDKNLNGSQDILPRFYKSFLLLQDECKAKDSFISSGVVTGLHPAVLEITTAREMFLCSNFTEIITEYMRGGKACDKKAESHFQRMKSLVEIHRPLAGLITNDTNKELSAKIKSFNLIHYLGDAPSTEKSLAVQALLKERDDVDESLGDVKYLPEDSKVIAYVLEQYQKLHNFAHDGLRVLVLQVKDLPGILYGVSKFLKDYLASCPDSDLPSFNFELMIYSTSSSPMSVERALTIWRDDLREFFYEKNRRLNLSVGHRFTPNADKAISTLHNESTQYDVAFISRFLGEEISGEVLKTGDFEYDYSNLSKFPICESPRPISEIEDEKRKTLLSNRRLRIQSLHADLSARLRTPYSDDLHFLIFGQVDYSRWNQLIEKTHDKAQWVSCVDPFIDKHLLNHGQNVKNTRRKIVGFSSGLGAYGELNLCISTEQDTLTDLTALVEKHMHTVVPLQDTALFGGIAGGVVKEAEEIIGLSSLHAMLGQGLKMHEVIGFAAIKRLIEKPEDAVVSQLLPLDSFSHWFVDQDCENDFRPDLLQLSLIKQGSKRPLIKAVVIECKLGRKNNDLKEHALEQVTAGLYHLSQLFAPKNSNLQRVQFDRRYWWAQLQRALISRSRVNLPSQELEQLDSVLGDLIDGKFDIEWQGSIFTFWTNREENEVIQYKHSLLRDLPPPCVTPSNFRIVQFEMGYPGLTEVLADEDVHKINMYEDGWPVISLFPENTIDHDESKDDSVIALQVLEKEDADVLWSAKEGRFKFDKSLIQEFDDTLEEVLLDVDEDDLGELTSPVEPVNTNIDFRPTELPQNGDLFPVDIPESNGSGQQDVVEQYTLDQPSNKKDDILPKVPDRVLLGTDPRGNPIYWHYGHDKLANRHMMIFGSSGFGKTYAIQCLLAEMAVQKLVSFIVDYTNGFLPDQIEKIFGEVAKPKDYFVFTEKLPLNPFEPQLKRITSSMPPIPESTYDIATRITAVFNSVYNMGEQQSAALTKVIEEVLDINPQPELGYILGRLEEEGKSGETLANKIRPFVKAHPFRNGLDSSWGAMKNVSGHFVNILQLAGLSPQIQYLVTEFVLWDLYSHAENEGTKYHPIPIVLDEIQNLDHSSNSPLDKMIREGRKFGLSLILATQDMEQFNQEQRARLFMTGHKLFFKPPTSGIDNLARMLSSATPDITKNEWSERLAKLEKGQCWSLGPVQMPDGSLREKAVLVNITSLDARKFGVA